MIQYITNKIKQVFRSSDKFQNIQNRLNEDLTQIDEFVSAKTEEAKALCQLRDDTNTAINKTMTEIEQADKIRTTIKQAIEAREGA